MAWLRGMRLFQVAQAVVCHTQLLFQHRHALGKLLWARTSRVSSSKRASVTAWARYHPLFRAAGSHHVGDNHPSRLRPAGDQRHQNCLPSCSHLRIGGVVQPRFHQAKVPAQGIQPGSVPVGNRPHRYRLHLDRLCFSAAGRATLW